MSNFKDVVTEFRTPCHSIRDTNQLNNLVIQNVYSIIDLDLTRISLTTPKTENDGFIHDQFPRAADKSIATLPSNYTERPSVLSEFSNPTV